MQIACRDFNVDLLNENLAARITLENLMTNQLLHLISLREPTRKTAVSSTCIDSIYSNIPVQQTRIKQTTFSDHYRLQFFLKNKKNLLGWISLEVAILKKASQSPYLKTAFNKCIYAGVFPQSMKFAKIIPICKAGEKTLPSNYRPI